jgi:predicted porin
MCLSIFSIKEVKLMKKSPIVAVLLLSGVLASSAWAEDGIQFSGTLDLAAYKGFDGKRLVGSISRSNVALSGEKSLSQGLTLTGKLNSRIWLHNPTTHENLVNEDPKYLGTAEATAGLKGDWGHVRFGRALTALWQNDWAYDAWYNYDSIASPAWQTWHGNSPADPNASQQGASFARLNDGVFYSSPSLGGFSVDASYGMKQKTGDTHHSQSVALKFKQEKFGAMLAHEKTPAGNAVSFVGANVKLGSVDLLAAYDRERLADGTENRSQTVSARYNNGAWTYMAGLGVQRDYGNAQFVGAGVKYAYNQSVAIYGSYGHKASGFWGSTKSSDAYGIGVSYSF